MDRRRERKWGERGGNCLKCLGSVGPRATTNSLLLIFRTLKKLAFTSSFEAFKGLFKASRDPIKVSVDNSSPPTGLWLSWDRLTDDWKTGIWQSRTSPWFLTGAEPNSQVCPITPNNYVPLFPDQLLINFIRCPRTKECSWVFNWIPVHLEALDTMLQKLGRVLVPRDLKGFFFLTFL